MITKALTFVVDVNLINWESKIMPVTIEQDLKEYLAKEFEKVNQQFEKVNQQFDKVNQELKEIREDITDLKVGQVRLEGDIKTLDEKVSGEIATVKNQLNQIKSEVSDLRNNQNKQIWTLIVAIMSVLIGTFIKIGLFSNP